MMRVESWHLGPTRERLAMVGQTTIDRRQAMRSSHTRRFERLRVVIADDHAVYREGLARMLRASGIEVVGEVRSGEDALRTVEAAEPDVVIMDRHMPGMSGLEATRRLTERVPAPRVLLLSVSAEESDVADAILAGASAYILKGGPVEELVAAIRAAAAGESPISPRIVSAMLRRVRELGRSDVALAGFNLSSRESEVLELLAKNVPTHEIAETLEITPREVLNHISSVLIKLQAENR
jgi:DNA-binding NarL/FixJ family response regulator